LEAAEKLNILNAIIKSVIPESAAGGYPESRKNNGLLDPGSRPPPPDLAGMTDYDVVLFRNCPSDSHPSGGFSVSKSAIRNNSALHLAP
jgi:hypothetical protein